MAMTRKHYREIAEALNITLCRAGVEYPYPKDEYTKGVAWAVKTMADELATMCKQDNPRFDREKFVDAVYEK